jgi:RNA 3'-terminal phosphate cyclase (GTP)
MPFDYFNNVFLPRLKEYAEINAILHKRGYYPKGGGSVEIRIKPKYNLESRKEAPRINLVEQGKLLQIKGISHASKHLQKSNVAQRQADAAKSALAELECSVDIRVEYCDTLSPGTGITLWALFSAGSENDEINPVVIGSDALGERGKPAENVGAEAAKSLMNEINLKAAVDEKLADNLIPFLALFGGRMKVTKISKHTLTNIYVAEQFLGKIFEINEEEKLITCKLKN